MKRVFKFVLALLFVSVVVLLTATCKIGIGLGETVDTTPPTVEIRKPDSGAILRGDFPISGVWTDDGTIKSLTAVVKNLASGSKISQTYDGEVVVSNSEDMENTWAFVINPKDANKPLVDGNYEATITMLDNGGHPTVVTRQFVIDNTPPVIILQRPSSAASSSDADVDSYGQTLTLEGMAADDNDVDHINVNIYSDESCLEKLGETITLFNVPPTISLDVTKYGEEAYSAIYGTEKVGAKRFYCTIEAFDSAQHYPTDGSNPTVEDSKGNSTGYYYLYENVTDLITAYKATGLYHILNGTYESTDGSRSLNEVISNTIDVLNSKQIKRGSFSLNPKNNPTFTVNGKSPLLDEGLDLETNADYEVTNGSDITIEVTPGLDNIPISYSEEGDLKSYLIECNKAGKILSGSKKIYLPMKDCKKSGSNYKITSTISSQLSTELVIGKYYVFGITGTDTSGNDILSSSDSGFGLKLISAGSAPTLTITEPLSSINYLKKGDSFVIKGYTTLEDGEPVVSVIYSTNDGSDTEEIWTPDSYSFVEEPTAGTKKKYVFEIAIPKEKFAQEYSKSYDLTIRSTANGKFTAINKNVMYDVEGPEISITTVSPTIEYDNYIDAEQSELNVLHNSYINGLVRIRGTVQDAFSSVNSVSWSVLQNNVVVPNIGETVGSTMDFYVDTTRLQNNSQTTIVITSTDASGNKTEKNLPYFLNQSTDRPIFEAQDGTSWKAGIYNPHYINEKMGSTPVNVLSSGSNLYSKVIDDDGIKYAVFSLIAVDKDDSKDATNPSEKRYAINQANTNALTESIRAKKYAVSGVEAMVSHQMPSSAGFYLVTQTIYDTNFIIEKADPTIEELKTAEADSRNRNYYVTKDYLIKISGNAPEVTLTRASKYVSTVASTSINVDIDVNGEPPYTISRQLYRNGALEAPFEIANNSESTHFTDTIANISTVNFESDKPIIYIVGDGAGTTTKTLTYTIDNDTPETYTIASPRDDSSAVGDLAINGHDYSFRGEAQDKLGGAGMKSLYYKFTSASETTAPTSGYVKVDIGDGTWNINVTLETGTGTNTETKLYEGKYKLWMYFADNAGNETGKICRVFTVDQGAPEVSEVKLNGSILLTENKTEYFNTSSGDFVISGKIADSYGLNSVKINGNEILETAAIDNDGNFSFTITRATETLNTEVPVTITVKDSADRVTEYKTKIYCDTKSPTVQITNPDNDVSGKDSISGSTYTFRGSVDDAGSGISVYKYLYTQTQISEDSNIISSATANDASSNGWISKTSGSGFAEEKTLGSSGMVEGKWYLYIYAMDNSGNEAVASRSFWIDLNDPTLSVTDIPNPTNQDIVIKGSASDTSSLKKVNVYIDDVVLTTDGTEVDISSLIAEGCTLTVGEGNLISDGTHNLKVVAEDICGKTTSWEQKNIVVDTIAPSSGSIETDTYGLKKGEDYVIIGENKWFKTETYNAKILESSITEKGSGIESVEVKLVKSGETADLSSGTQTLSRRKPDSDGKWKYTGKVDIACQGANDVYTKVTDKAENISAVASIDTIYVDTLPPSVKVYEETTSTDPEKITAGSLYLKEISGTKLTNGTTSKVVYLKPEEDISAGDGSYSGIDYVKYQYINNKDSNKTEYISIDASQTGVPIGYYKLTIPANVENGVNYQVKGAAKFVVADLAGNITIETPFTFDIDTLDPSIGISTITDADVDTEDIIDVNGYLTVSGTASDNNTISKVQLKYYVGEKTDTPDWANITANDVTGTNNWSYEINTSLLEDGKYLFLKAYATDSSGNVGTSKTVEGAQIQAETVVYINQESDRPVITFNNLDLTKPSDIWLKGVSTITGNIRDDDGVTTFKYKEKNAASWTTIPVSNGSWKIANISDGDHEYYFQVETKSEKTGVPAKTFETATAKQPVLKSDGDSSISTGTVSVAFKVDKTSPKYINSSVMYQSKDKDGNLSDWKVDPNELNFGGNYTSFSLKLNAYDENGVDSMKILFNGEEIQGEIVVTADEIAAAGNENAAKEAKKQTGISEATACEWIFKDIAISTLETFNGTQKLALTILDKAGLEKEDSFTIVVDNKKPRISFTNYKPNASVFATSDISIIGQVDSADLKEWKYVVTESAEAPTTGWKDLITGQTFNLVFDNGISTDSETHDKSLFKYIAELEDGVTEETLTNDDTVRNMYIWVYGVDECGNTSDKTSLHLKVTPNGDKPSISFTYPTNVGQGLGGTVRVTGSTSIKDKTVKAVYIQIDPKPTVNGTTVTANWANWNTNLTEAENGTERYARTASGTSYGDAILVNGTPDSWNISLNRYKEFNGSAYNNVVIRAFAVSTSNKVSDPVEIWFRIDPNAPLIGETKKLELVKDASTKQLYTDNMWIKGGWILTGSVEDESGIKGITFNDGTNTVDLVVNTNPTDSENIIGAITTVAPYNTYVLKAKLSKKYSEVKEDGKDWYTDEALTTKATAETPDDTIVYRYDSYDVISNKKYGAVKADGNTWYTDSTLTTPATPATSDEADVYKKLGENFNYILNIPVGNTNANEFGSLKYTIEAEEGTPNGLSSPKEITLNFDNKDPDYKVIQSSTNTTTEVTTYDIKQTAGTAGFYGLASEEGSTGKNQSGFNFVAMYFTREVQLTEDSTAKTYVIDPMLGGGTSGTDNFVSSDNCETYVAKSSSGDGLYWLKGKTVTIQNESELILSSTPEKNIRIGGLVKINNVIYIISAVDYTNKKVTLKGTLTNGTATAYFAVAQVINNTTAEGNATVTTTKEFDFNNPIGANDDDDQMLESVISSGTSYVCSAWIDSSLMMDGPVKVHFVAFDNAGNLTEVIKDGNVSNNAPRLYGVKYGTDVNGDGTIDGDEWIDSQKYSVLENTVHGYKDDGLTQKVTEIEIPEAKRLTIKGKTTVIPQVVGGNVDLGYRLQKADTKEGSKTSVKNNTALNVGHSSSQLKREDFSITLETADFLNATTGIADGDYHLFYEIFDYTHGTTPATNANVASVILPVTVAIQDTTAPTATVKPFYWTSEDVNSLYKNSRENGHIEIAAQPKISGIVTFEGQAKDNVIVTQIYATIPGYNSGNAVLLAERNGSNVWEKKIQYNIESKALTEKPSDWPTGYYTDAETTTAAPATYSNDTYYVRTGIQYETEEISESFDETTGENIVDFKFSFNTEKISTVAAENVEITFTAKDRGKAVLSGEIVTYPTKNTSTPGSTQTTEETNTGYYKVDVVPYITEVTRNSTYNTNRARSGAIPLLRGETLNTIKGFNIATLTSSSLKITPNKDGSGTAVDMTNLAISGSNLTFTVPTTAESGYLHLVINNVAAVNNTNDYVDSNTETNAKAYDHNTLTDDRYVLIWRVSAQDTFKGSKNAVYPAMSKNPVDNVLYASFTNYGQSKTYYTNQFTGNTAVGVSTNVGNNGSNITTDGVSTVFNGYDPPEMTDLSVGSDGQVNVFYAANYHGGNPGNWNGTGSTDAGGIYIYDLNAELVDCERSSHNIWRSELFTYDDELNQFKNLRINRVVKNNVPYSNVVYYDRLTNAVKFGYAANEMSYTAKASNVTFTYNASITTYPYYSRTSNGTVEKVYTASNNTNYDGNYVLIGGIYYRLTRNAYYAQRATTQSYYYTLDYTGNATFTSNVYIGNISFPDTRSYGMSWVTLDGSYDTVDNGGGNFTFATTWKPFILTDERYSGVSRASGTGESVALTANQNGYAVVLYMDADSGQLRIARANSLTPNAVTNWTVQGVFASTDENYDTASDYMSCAVDSDGYLHIAFQNTKGQLVYAKSTNAPSDGNTAYTFGRSEVLDDSGMWIDMTMDGDTPYISYLSRVNSYDGMKLAFKDSSFDEDNDGVADTNGGWETMTAPLNAKVTNVRSCIEVNAKAQDDNEYKAAIGFCPGADYRAAFFVGK